MKNFYFYCPRCGYETEVNQLPRGTVANPRDGWGTGIYHYECVNCGNLDAGYMRNIVRGNDTLEEWQKYCRSVISLYQNIRTKEPKYEL